MHTHWILEGIAADGSIVRHPLHTLPYRVGRDAGNALVLDGAGLSRQHAEFTVDAQGRLWLADLGSTNGSFVNRERIEAPRAVDEDDVIHFGNAEFRLRAVTTLSERPSAEVRTLLVPRNPAQPGRFVREERPFMELLGGRGLTVVAQPIVDAASGRLHAYELLGRGAHPELPVSPMHLFDLARQLDREAELSDAFRRHGVAQIAPRLGGAELFVNTHPRETFGDALLQSLQALRAAHPDISLVVEIHEAAVVEVDRMRELAAWLRHHGIRFAYDDFGAGQARINELVDVPAHCVKFDMGLVRDIHRASERKQRVVRDLVRMVLDIGSVPLAEGVEFPGDEAVCREMGFALLQGYHTGRPMPLDRLPA